MSKYIRPSERVALYESGTKAFWKIIADYHELLIIGECSAVWSEITSIDVRCYFKIIWLKQILH